MQTRVAITGFGAVSAAGLGVDNLWQAAKSGTSHVGALDVPRVERLRVRIAASVRDFRASDHLSKDELQRTERFSHFAHVAAVEAIKQAGILPEQLAGDRSAVIVGTGIGGITTMDESYAQFFGGERRLDPFTIPKVMPSAAASHLSIAHRITGPSFAVSSACSSGTQAIGLGIQMVRHGLVDRALVGGSEASLTSAVMKSWELMRVLSPDTCRPFSKDRNGLVLGEGAGIFVIESEACAQARNAKPLAWISGYGTSSDAKDIIQPDEHGAARAMQLALEDAGLAPGDIGYVNAHGTGTILNDINETAAIKRVFGDETANVPVSSVKQLIGHTLGASGALEFAVTVRSLIERACPPHTNLSEADPRCDLYLPPESVELAPSKAVLCNSFAFGGVNASLIATRVAD
ncbi:beta-ketoacyl-[acyl-carrier-protein] synthase family protein [Hoeflea sp.]|uniref:beta-ketoacyl-[acyl-carrier-protein] synthase family protein n=1 Tax=Hoeflea sp. TaxID=1940281 RepID=UPI003B5244FA